MKLLISSLFLIAFFLIPDIAGIACPRGFSVVNNQKCLRMFTNHLKHLEAENDCSYLGGTLVTIKTAIDNRAVTTLAASAGATNVWVGIFCFAAGNTTTCYHDDNSGKISYKSFAPGNPAVQGNGGCVYMSVTGKSSGQWISAPCEVLGLPFVCEVPPTIADPTCTRNYNGYCYTTSTEISPNSATASYSKAQAICQANGAQLVSLHSKPEIDFVRGIYRGSGVQTIYLGAQAFLPDTFDWADGSHWDYDYTDPLAYGKGSCLVMDLTASKVNNGMWSEANCQMSYNFLCKRKIMGAVLASTVSTVEEQKIAEEQVNPKLRRIQKALLRRQELLDFSNCNTTLYLAPGTITSYGYPNTKPPVTFCTWTVAALGPYRVGVYFTDFSVYRNVYLYDEYGNQLSNPSGTQRPFQVLASSNIVKISHDSSYDAQYNYHGFSATILPF